MATFTSAVRRVLSSPKSQHLNLTQKLLSTNTSAEIGYNITDASKLVQGVTNADLEKDPVLREYFEVNFPGFGKTEPAQTTATEEIVSSAESDALEEVARADNIRTLSCYTRDWKTEEGTRKCYKLRDEQLLIPGVLYGGDPTQNISSKGRGSRLFVKTPWNQIERELALYTYHNFESRVYDLTVYESEDDDEGTVHRVLPKNVQFHPIKNKIYCCNYLRYYPGRFIDVPIVYINEEESPALKRGGFIQPISRYVRCTVEDGVPIPDRIELDCTDLQLKDVLRTERLIYPDGVKMSPKIDKDHFLVGTVFGRRAEMSTTEEEGGDDGDTEKED